MPRVIHSRTVGSDRITATTFLTLTGPALPLRGCSLLANFRPLAAPLLAFGGLPPPNLFQAFGFLAVPLLPVPRLVAVSAAFSQADTRAESVATRRTTS